ncbi:MAG: YfaZ family outer membrane protein [Campylobacterota bacterium]|nr:YfaZ family outer membrane protein [Campylobacterota bacterium]
MLKKISLIAFLSVSAFAMHSGELNINTKDLEVSAKLDMGQFNTTIEPHTMFIGGKFLNADGEHSSPEFSDIKPYVELNALLMQEIGNHGMSIGMGVKVSFTENYAAIPLGLEFSYKIPASDLVPMYLNGSLYYAPSVLSMRDADSFLEYRISYDIEIIKNGYITVGYRNLDTNYEGNSDFTYNESFYGGFKIGF